MRDEECMTNDGAQSIRGPLIEMPKGWCVCDELVVEDVAGAAALLTTRRRVWQFSGRLMRRALSECENPSVHGRHPSSPGAPLPNREELWRRLAGHPRGFYLWIHWPSAEAADRPCRWILEARHKVDAYHFDAKAPAALRRELRALSEARQLGLAAKAAKPAASAVSSRRL